MYSGHLLGVHMIKQKNTCKTYFVTSQTDRDQTLICCQREAQNASSGGADHPKKHSLRKSNSLPAAQGISR